jgi:hypothetical protein
LFLKIVYHGPRAMEELAQYDPNLVVGISAAARERRTMPLDLSTTRRSTARGWRCLDAKLTTREHQLAFIEMLRLITDGKVTPEEAVRAYHGVLQARNIKPKLTLEKDLELTDQAMSYDGNGGGRAVVSIRNNPLGNLADQANHKPEGSTASWPVLANGRPDFANMNPMQRRAYDLNRLARKFG